MNATHVPSSKTAREALAALGLGEKHLTLHINAGSTELHAALLETFPKLRHTGGYTMLRCMGKNKLLQVLDPPPGGHTPTSISASVEQSRVYVRPLQCSIPLISQESRVDREVSKQMIHVPPLTPIVSAYVGTTRKMSQVWSNVWISCIG